MLTGFPGPCGRRRKPNSLELSLDLYVGVCIHRQTHGYTQRQIHTHLYVHTNRHRDIHTDSHTDMGAMQCNNNFKLTPVTQHSGG